MHVGHLLLRSAGWPAVRHTVPCMDLISILAQDSSTDLGAGGGALMAVIVFAYLALLVLMLVGYWKVFTKIGLPGWMGIIPFVNVYMLFKARSAGAGGVADPLAHPVHQHHRHVVPCQRHS